MTLIVFWTHTFLNLNICSIVKLLAAGNIKRVNEIEWSFKLHRNRWRLTNVLANLSDSIPLYKRNNIITGKVMFFFILSYLISYSDRLQKLLNCFWNANLYFGYILIFQKSNKSIKIHSRCYNTYIWYINRTIYQFNKIIFAFH